MWKEVETTAAGGEMEQAARSEYAGVEGNQWRNEVANREGRRLAVRRNLNRRVAEKRRAGGPGAQDSGGAGR